MVRLGHVRQVQRDVVAAREQLIQVIDQLDPPRLDEFLLRVRLEGQHVHAQTRGPSGHRAADTTESDDADRAAHHAGIRLAEPATVHDPVVPLRKSAGHAHQQRDRVFGHRVMIDPGRDRDNHALLVTGGKIDGIETDTAPRNHSQVRQRLDHLASVGFGPGRDRRDALHLGNQVVGDKQVDTAIDRFDIEPGVGEDFKMRTTVRVDRCADDLGHVTCGPSAGDK